MAATIKDVITGGEEDSGCTPAPGRATVSNWPGRARIIVAACPGLQDVALGAERRS
jgi:hypothetical protein